MTEALFVPRLYRRRYEEGEPVYERVEILVNPQTNKPILDENGHPQERVIEQARGKRDALRDAGLGEVKEEHRLQHAQDIQNLGRRSRPNPHHMARVPFTRLERWAGIK